VGLRINDASIYPRSADVCSIERCREDLETLSFYYPPRKLLKRYFRTRDNAIIRWVVYGSIRRKEM
jgi:hypothetical protein